MAFLACYLDESADGEREEVFAVAGFSGYTPSWFELERQWRARLTKHGLQYFRAADCENVRGPFASLRVDKRKLRREERIRAEQVWTELIEIVKRTGMVGIGVGMLMKDFNEAIQDEIARKIFSTDPYHLTYRLAFTRVADVSLGVTSPRVLSLLFAMSTNSIQLKPKQLTRLSKREILIYGTIWVR